MEKIGFGCIGLKGIGQTHIKALQSVEDARLIAVCDNVPEIARRAGEGHQVAHCTDYHEMLKNDEVQVVCIGTPHYLHHPMTVAALESGKHVLCEKPLAVTVKQADEMNATARRVGRKLGVFHQYRTNPTSAKMKEIVSAGTLGKMVRVTWLACSLRTQRYYDSDAWRGTWAQEGGGVLINQVVHDLDLLGWLAGDVAEVIGAIETKVHRVQTEDVATTIFRFANGAHGIFQASLVESPGSSHHEIAGDEGTLYHDRDGLRLGRPSMPVSQFILNSDQAWGRVEVTWETIEVEKRPSGHAVLVQDMIDAIRQDREVFVPGEQGAKAVELVNAVILSSRRSKNVALPLDREEYEGLWRELSKGGQGR